MAYDPITGHIVLYAQGVRQNSLTTTLAGVEQYGKTDERIVATIVMNGRDAAHDEVKYIVVEPDSFFDQLQSRKEVRYALAGRGAYSPQQDMPKFGLKRLDNTDLFKLGVPFDIRTLLGPADQNGVPGFSAALYQDFLAGEDQYVLAFGGTDDVWAGEWDDWRNNVEQALGRYAPQYATAMRIADALVNATPGIPAGHLVTTGHSLGGGLASAASVVSGIHAYTYNAAGLSESTLYARDAIENPIPDGMGGYTELYAGSLGRYDFDTLYIDAYYSRWDVLSQVQDLTPIPNAIGYRHTALQTPAGIDVGVALDAALLAVGIASGQTWAVAFGTGNALTYMVEAHRMNTVLYGLLVDEGPLNAIELDALGIDTYFP
jgi:hypothetical protein